MKKLLSAISCCFIAVIATAQQPAKPKKTAIMNQTVEASCGSCKFGMKAKDCALAVRIAGKSYFVDGFGIDDFGDAHEKHGFCNLISKAVVSGKIVNGRFKATSFKLAAGPGKKDALEKTGR